MVISPEGWVLTTRGRPRTVAVARGRASVLRRAREDRELPGPRVGQRRDRPGVVPARWRLFLPDLDRYNERRDRARSPRTSSHPKWQLALDILDELLTGACRVASSRPTAATAISPRSASVLSARSRYVVQIKAITSAQPADATPSPPPTTGVAAHPSPRYPDNLSASGPRSPLVVGAPTVAGVRRPRPAQQPLHRVPYPSRQRRSTPARRRPARTVAAGRVAREQAEPVKYWLSNLPADTPLLTLVRLAKLRWRVEHDYRELKQCLGLDHYEGRTYRGLHHHLTSVTVAHAFLTCCRLHQDPGRPQLAAA